MSKFQARLIYNLFGGLILGACIIYPVLLETKCLCSLMISILACVIFLFITGYPIIHLLSKKFPNVIGDKSDNRK